MTIVEGILFLIKKNKISIYELSKRAGLSSSTISNLLNRGNNPSLATLESICKALNIQLWEFFFLLDPKNEFTDTREMLADYLTLPPKQKRFFRTLLNDIKNFSR